MNSYKAHGDIDKFLDSLPKKDRVKVDRAVEMLELKEYRLEMPFSRKISENLHELRVKSSQNVRVFYTFYQNSVFLLHIIGKKGDKIPQKDLKTATARLKSLRQL